ncbi:MAG: phosphoribosyltransferase family protein, partial [Rikenellaceae bacterium]
MILKFFKRLFLSIRELLYPPICRICGKRLLERESFLCGDCLADMPLTMQIDYPYNNFMHKKFEDLGIERACCYFSYQKSNRYPNIIKEIKFGRDKSLAIYMGNIFGDMIKSSYEFEDIDFVVPIPLHHRRLRQRGYNQSDLIGKGIATALGVPLITNAVKRVKSTKPQSSLLHNYDRKDNMRGAFEVIDSSIFSDKHILIVDDVSTTGETISAFVKTLRKRYKHIN